MSPTREQRDAKLTRLATELAMTLHLRAEAGEPTASLAEIAGLPVGITAGLIAAGRRMF